MLALNTNNMSQYLHCHVGICIATLILSVKGSCIQTFLYYWTGLIIASQPVKHVQSKYSIHYSYYTMLYYRYISVFEHIFANMNEWTNKCTNLKITKQSSTLYLFFTISYSNFLNMTWKINIHTWYNFNNFESKQTFLLADLTT